MYKNESIMDMNYYTFLWWCVKDKDKEEGGSQRKTSRKL